MAVFAVHLSRSAEQTAERLEQRYPDDSHFKLSDTLYLVRADTVAERISENIGIKGDDRIEDAAGVVFKLNAAYSGFDSRSLWDWLALAESP